MKIPEFDVAGFDKATFAPFTLVDARRSEWKDVRLSFRGWEWLRATYGSDRIEDYYFNGYSVEALVKAVRLEAGMKPDAKGVVYNSECDSCYIHFDDFGEAVKSANLAAAMMNDREKLVQMIEFARKSGFDES